MGKIHSDKSTQKNEPPVSVGPGSNFPKHLAETAWRVAVPFLIFSLGGIKLDEKYDTSPLFSVIGIFIALVAVTVIVYKYVDKHYPDTFKGIKND